MHVEYNNSTTFHRVVPLLKALVCFPIRVNVVFNNLNLINI